MKATGIVRRIDDLGRVVIPKEIRRTMRIREGDPLEIFTEKDGEVIFKKYSPIGELGEFAAQICESMHRASDCAAVVCDRDSVIAVSGVPKRELMDRRVSAELEQIMESRGGMRCSGRDCVKLVDSDEPWFASAAVPIISQGDVLGCVAFAKKQAAEGTELELKLAQTVASFLGKQMEN